MTSVAPARTVPGGSVPPVLTALPSLGALCRAFGRRWLLALMLGLAGAALVGWAIWQLIPAPYVSELFLQLRRPGEKMPNRGDSGHEEFMRAQATLLKSSHVFTLALRNDKVKTLSIVQDRPDPFDWLTKDLMVKYQAGDNHLLIKLTGEEPEELPAVISALIEGYKEILREEVKAQELRLEEAGKQIDAQLAVLSKGPTPPDSKQLDQARSDLATEKEKLRAAESALFDQERQQPELKEKDIKPDDPRLKDVVDAVLSLNPKAVDLLKQIDDKNKLIKDTLRISALGENDPSLPDLYTERKDLEDQLARIRTAAKVAGQLVQRANAGHDLLLARARENVAALRRQVEVLTRKVTEMQDKDTPEARARAAKIKALEEAQKQNFAELNNLVVHGHDLSWVIPLGQPTTPRERDREKQIKVAGLGAFSVFGLVLFTVALVEFRTRRVTCSDEVTQGLGIATVGTIPVLPAPARGAALTGNAQHGDGRQAVLIESIDALRTLLLRTLGDGPRVVLVTSAVSREGKTSLACQLAASLARAWRKTLLIDGDLRKPAAHQQFDVPVEPGLSEVLRRDLEVGDVVRETLVGRLRVMPAGQWDNHALQALAQEGVATLFEQLKEEYEFIIVDSCPVLPVTDTLLLGQHADTVLFSVLRGTSRLPAVYAARQRLAALDIPVLGAVVIGGSSTFSGLDIQYPRPANA